MRLLVGALAISSFLVIETGPIHLQTLFASPPIELFPQQLLAQESAGQSLDRRAELSHFLNTKSATEAADFLRWHAGFLNVNNEWKAVESFSESDAQVDYLDARDRLLPTQDGALKLAQWCRKYGLEDRAKAHCLDHLRKEPNDLTARTFLGHIQIDHNWVDEKVVAAKQQELTKTIDTIKTWTPEIEAILQGLRSRNTKSVKQALHKLEAIDTETAMPALELFGTSVDDDLAKPIVRKIASEQSPEACETLIRIGLTHPSDEIRRITSNEIQQYPRALYIPFLLKMLEEDLQVATQLSLLPNGVLSLETILANELEDKQNIRHFKNCLSAVAHFSSQHSAKVDITQKLQMYWWSYRHKIPLNNPVEFFGLSFTNRSFASGSTVDNRTYVPERVVQAAAETADLQAQQLKNKVAQYNRFLESVVHNVCSLLRATTGQQLEDSPKAWWQWWIEENERYATGKPVDYQQTGSSRQIKISSEFAASFSQRAIQIPDGRSLMRVSCLAEGTLIQTERGLTPVEEIQIGDRVVSQDVESAELTLKAVVQTTIRPPNTTKIIVFAKGGEINATGGHNWWASGHGWTKTSNLKPGMMLHTATGVEEIKEVIESPKEIKTYNLVVDDFHTYFVGPERVLSYDNSDLVPSLLTVPGYVTE